MSSNFEFLQTKWPQLAAYGELAEKYLYSDSNATLIKLRLFGEKIVKYIFENERLEEYISENQSEKIKILRTNDLIDDNILNMLHNIRRMGNKASHEGYSSESHAKELLESTYKISIWFMETYGQWDFKAKPFCLESNIKINANENIAEIDKLEKISKNNEVIAASEINTEEMKIGTLVRKTFKTLLLKEKVTQEILNHLQEEAYSKLNFDINYAFLKKVNMTEPLTEQRKVNKYPRYWKDAYKINGEYYILCNDWYIRNKNKYVNWVISLGAADIIQDISNFEEAAVSSISEDNKINEEELMISSISNKKTRTRQNNATWDEKVKENKVAYYLSRFEHNGLYENCNQGQAFKIIAEKLNMNNNTLKNKRDYFDPYCNKLKVIGPKRKGWWQAELPSDLKYVYELYLNKSKEEIEEEIKEILTLK